MPPANDAAPLTYIRSKDGSVQIAVEMTDELHALTWGRLHTSTLPHPVQTITVADPVAWVRAERMIGQLTMSERLAARRDALAPGERRAAA